MLFHVEGRRISHFQFHSVQNKVVGLARYESRLVSEDVGGSMKPNFEGEVPWSNQVRTAADAVRFIDAVGYCLLFPIKKLPLPSLYYAVARRNIHLGPTWDKYCEMIWHWKDDLPRKRRAFYAKYFKGRGTFISLTLLPHFLAMRDSAASPGHHERFYAGGRISHDARTI